MSAVSPKEIEEALKRVNETMSKEINIDEVITAFTKLGIQVKNPDGSFKSWFDILNEMSEVWNKLSVNKDTSQ